MAETRYSHSAGTSTQNYADARATATARTRTHGEEALRGRTHDGGPLYLGDRPCRAPGRRRGASCVGSPRPCCRACTHQCPRHHPRAVREAMLHHPHHPVPCRRHVLPHLQPLPPQYQRPHRLRVHLDKNRKRQAVALMGRSKMARIVTRVDAGKATEAGEASCSRPTFFTCAEEAE
uniref:Uncharacterized protein n=1 Tax=Setaria italica TaxID=4555 RepID=K3XPQ1_SETIT